MTLQAELRSLKTRGIVVALFLALLGSAAKAKVRKPEFDIVKVAAPPVIDGKLDDKPWALAPAISEFHQLRPIEYGTPTQRTEVRVLRDDEYLYLAVRLFYDTPADVTANVSVPSQRLEFDDRFGFYFDTFLDHRNAYYFELNANGIQADALIVGNASWINEWDGIWQAVTLPEENGWVGEIRIPFSTMSFDPTLDHWGVNFFRDLRNTQELLAWSSDGLQKFPRAPAAAGTMNGMSAIRNGIGLGITPSLTFNRNRDFVSNSKSDQFDPSLDISYRITPSLNSRLTLNTDFSATEADDRQINLTRFSLFFPEKREFFLQDAGIFEFAQLEKNGRPFFSRAIGLSDNGDPLNLEFGLKTSGRLGRYNVGLLGVRQEATGQMTNQDLFVGRVAANVLKESSVGAIITHGDPRSLRNAVTTGVDLHYRSSGLPGNRVMQGELWFQRTANDPADPIDTSGGVVRDNAWGAHFQLPNDRHYVDLWHLEFGENFEPALGFVNRTGITDDNLEYRFRHRRPQSYWSVADHSISLRRIASATNSEFTEALGLKPLDVETRHGDRFAVELLREREVLVAPFELFRRITIDPGAYNFDRMNLLLTTAQHRRWRLSIELQSGSFYGGTRKTQIFTGGAVLHRRVSIEGTYNSSDVDVSDSSFIARLYSLRSKIALSSRLSLVPLVQYDNVSEALGFDVRVRWQPQRGQDIYFIWKQNMLRDSENEFHRTEQQGVVKGVFNWRF